MRTILFSGLAILCMVACKSKTENTETPASSEKLEYPYTLKDPYQEWQAGDQQSAVMVLKMIKAWETKNLTECATYFADTVKMHFDYYRQDMPHDSIASFLENSWKDMASVKVDMQDWEAVISKDQKEQWVTVWYKQIMTDSKGKVDSVNIIDDSKIEDGKIAVFSEYIQHFPGQKK